MCNSELHNSDEFDARSVDRETVAMTQSTQIRLARRPVGEPQDADFSFVTTDLPALEDGQVLVRTLYLSLDPYMRGRMSDAESYAQPVDIGDVMVGATVCEVVESRSDRRQVGDVVLAYTGWQTHAVTDGRLTRRLDLKSRGHSGTRYVVVWRGRLACQIPASAAARLC